MSKKITEVRIETAGDRADNAARVATGQRVATMYPTSTVVAANPPLGAACVDYVTKAKAVGDAETALTQALAVVEKCRGARDLAVINCDKSHAVLCNQAQTYCKTPADVTSIGLHELELASHVGQLPEAIAIKQNMATHELEIHIKYASGTHNVILEISPDPITVTPNSYVLQKGHGMKRTIAAPPPGVIWVRAATSLANGQTTYFGPVSFTVK